LAKAVIAVAAPGSTITAPDGAVVQLLLFWMVKMYFPDGAGPA
jgi:hypothetical protein